MKRRIRNKILRLSLIASTLFFLIKPVYAQIDASILRRHVQKLSGDEMEGRGTGEPGEAEARGYIASEFKRYGLTAYGANNGFLQKFEFRPRNSSNPHAAIDTTQPVRSAYNVIAYLNNSAENTIIIGAHYDHLGLGRQGGSLDPNPEGKIHNGADDNASGTAGLLELARFYRQNKIKEKYNFLFIAFSGEELGLLGSKAFTANPSIDLNKVHLMINMDMIGRLDSARRLMIYGTGTSPVLENLIRNTSHDFQIKTDSSGIGPSDHTSFYLKNIPVLHFFTGSHSDYHKPSDDADKVNYDGQKDVLEYIQRIIEKAEAMPKLAFTATRNNSTASDSPRFKVTLGILPDYAFTGGMRVDGVTDGKPAAVAGLKAGDVIVQIGEHVVFDIQTYMQALSKFTKGETTSVKIKRGEDTLDMKVVF